MSGNRTSVPYTDEERYQHDKQLFIALMNLHLANDDLSSEDMVTILKIADEAGKKHRGELFLLDENKFFDWKVGPAISIDEIENPPTS